MANDPSSISPPPVSISSEPRIGNVKGSLEIGTTVNVLAPSEIIVKLVDAKGLGEYEVWLGMASILSSAFVGFFVAYCQSGDLRLLVNAGVFGLLFVITLGRAVYKRWSLTKHSEENDPDASPSGDANPHPVTPPALPHLRSGGKATVGYEINNPFPPDVSMSQQRTPTTPAEGVSVGCVIFFCVDCVIFCGRQRSSL